MEKETKKEEELKEEKVEDVTKVQETSTGEGTPTKEEVPNPKIEKKEPVWRKIEILTDGNEIKIEKAEVSGKIEMIAILQNLVGFLSQK